MLRWRRTVLFGAISPRPAADLMRGTGRSGLVQGAVATMQGRFWCRSRALQALVPSGGDARPGGEAAAGHPGRAGAAGRAGARTVDQTGGRGGRMRHHARGARRAGRDSLRVRGCPEPAHALAAARLLGAGEDVRRFAGAAAPARGARFGPVRALGIGAAIRRGAPAGDGGCMAQRDNAAAGRSGTDGGRILHAGGRSTAFARSPPRAPARRPAAVWLPPSPPNASTARQTRWPSPSEGKG